MKKINGIQNLKIKKAAVALALVGTLSLTGCGNRQLLDVKHTFNKAILVNDGIATIVEISKWADYEGEQLQLILEDGTVLLTSSFDTKLVDDRNGNISVEDIARSLVGSNGEVTYLEQSNIKTR